MKQNHLPKGFCHEIFGLNVNLAPSLKLWADFYPFLVFSLDQSFSTLALLTF